jgi:DNA-binding SARP family transcriptional activator
MDVHLSSGERAGAAVMQPRRLATLAYLLLARPRGLHSRDTLIAMLWPDADQASGRHALRNCLHAIRHALGEHVVATAGDGLVGVDGAHLHCDVLALETALAEGRSDEALARYTGELLTGFHVSEAPAFEHWLDGERHRLRTAVVAAAAERVEALRAGGDAHGAAVLARRAHEIAPDDERSLRRLVQCLHEAGDRAGALRAYEEFARRVALEFDSAPAAETMALVERLRAESVVPLVVPLDSVAVLPFSDRSGRDDGAELAEGLGAGIANRLARLARFHVVARSALAGRRADDDALAASRAVGVDAVITGVVAGAGELLRVRLEIVRVRDGRLLLGDVFESGPGNLASLEGHLAVAASRALGATAADELDRVGGDLPARSSEAYLLYVRGQHCFLRAAAGGHPGDLDTSRALFERAFLLDPAFAPAIAGLSNYYAVAAARNRLRPFDAAFARAIALSREALSLDPSLAIPHVHLGVNAMYLDGDWGEAERRFSTVVRLDASYAEGHRFLAILRELFGRMAEALEHHAEAVRLEPRMPIYRNGYAAALMAVGRPAEAEAELRAALALDPRYWAARERLLRCLERTGRLADAVAERRGDERGRGDGFAAAFARDGEAGYRAARAEELRNLIRTLAERLAAATEEEAGDRFNPPELRLALAHAELGEWDAALECERRATSERPWRRQWFVSHPDLAPLATRR